VFGLQFKLHHSHD